MICTWRDHRPVTASCSLCGGAVQTTAQVRGKIYCLPCRGKRRRQSAQEANERARQKRLTARIESPEIHTLPHLCVETARIEPAIPFLEALQLAPTAFSHSGPERQGRKFMNSADRQKVSQGM